MNWEDIPLNTSIGKEPYDGRNNCARGTLPLNSTTATGTPSCVPPGLKSLVALQFSSNYDSEESNATGAERRASEE
jgi:hypothetical protein